MKKKKKVLRSKRVTVGKSATHIHYFYVIAASLIVGTVIAGGIASLHTTNVLGVTSTANPGSVNVVITGVDRTTRTEIHIDTKTGEVIEIDDASGSSQSGSMNRLRQKALEKVETIRENADKKRKNNNHDKKADTVAPGKVVKQIVADEILDEVATASGDPSRTIITEDTINGKPVYVIQGTVKQKLLGFIPVTITKNVTVSQETGNVLSTTSPVLSGILDIFSF